MAFQPVPDTASVTVRLRGATGQQIVGAEAQFSMYVRDEAANPPWDATALQLLADYTKVWMDTGKNGGSGGKASLSDGWFVIDVVAHDLSQLAGLSATAIAGFAGTGVSAELSAALAMWVKFNGTPGDLPKDGGVFWPHGREDVLDGDTWQSGTLSGVKTLFDDWRADLNDPTAGGKISWAHVIVSRSRVTDDSVKNARQALRDAIAATRLATAETALVQSVQPRALVATQRDRRAGQ